MPSKLCGTIYLWHDKNCPLYKANKKKYSSIVQRSLQIVFSYLFSNYYIFLWIIHVGEFPFKKIVHGNIFSTIFILFLLLYDNSHSDMRDLYNCASSRGFILLSSVLPWRRAYEHPLSWLLHVLSYFACNAWSRTQWFIDVFEQITALPCVVYR